MSEGLRQVFRTNTERDLEREGPSNTETLARINVVVG